MKFLPIAGPLTAPTPRAARVERFRFRQKMATDSLANYLAISNSLGNQFDCITASPFSAFISPPDFDLFLFLLTPHILSDVRMNKLRNSPRRVPALAVHLTNGAARTATARNNSPFRCSGPAAGFGKLPDLPSTKRPKSGGKAARHAPQTGGQTRPARSTN